MADHMDRMLVHFILEEEYGDELERDFQKQYGKVLETAVGVLGMESPDMRSESKPSTRSERKDFALFDRLNHERERAEKVISKIVQSTNAKDLPAQKVLAEMAEIERDFEYKIDELHAAISNKPVPQAGNGVGARGQEPPDKLSAITDYLRGRFPSSPNIKAAQLTPVPGGRSKETSFVKIENTGELPGEVVLRKDGAGGLIDTTVADEYELIKIVYDHGGVPIPKPFFVEKNPDILDGTFMFLEKIDGNKPGEYYVDVEAPTQGRYEIGADLARLLGRLHSIDTSMLARTNLSLDVDVKEVIVSCIEESRQRLEATKREPAVELELAYHWLDDHMEDGMDIPRLIHSDMGLHNMLVRDNRIVAVLDWEMAKLAAPAMDIGYCRHLIDYLIPWDDFVRIYQENGGPPSACDPKAVRFYAVLAYTGITTFCMYCRHAFCSGMTHDLVIANAGHNFLYRAKKLLTGALAEAFGIYK
jgi:aminoglycoside phosphotransferase (APT) family kinase protein